MNFITLMKMRQMKLHLSYKLLIDYVYKFNFKSKHILFSISFITQHKFQSIKKSKRIKLNLMAQRKSWTTEEDQFITFKVENNQKLPEKDRLKWGDIADELNIAFPESKRSGKQCRQRWHNQLDPSISRSQWTLEEEKKLFDLQKQLGNKWAVIASKLKGRTDNNVKNYFYSTLRKSLRKLNTFISTNRAQLKNAKQFKETSLSKLLAVADHKFVKKINIKKVQAEDEAIEIKNMLIEITNLQTTQMYSRNLFISLVKKLQEWNKCCKKKKGKRKVEEEKEIQRQEEQDNSQMEEENQNQSVDSQEEQRLRRNKNSAINPRQVKRHTDQRSRSRNKTKINKKQSNISKNSRKSIKQNQKKDKLTKQQTKQKIILKNKLSRQPSIPQFSKKTSLRNHSNSSNNQNFIDLARSSMDMGKYQKKQSNSDSQLFKSFLNEVPVEQNNQKKTSFSSRVQRANSNMSFLNMIKEVSLAKNQSRQSDIIDFLQQDDGQDPFYMDMLRKQSSRKEIPLFRDQSNYWNLCGLDQSLRFQPQISKLRSFKRDSANFQHQYKFGDSKIN